MFKIVEFFDNVISQTGGWVGYFSYDTVRYVEKKKLPFMNAPVDDRNLPDVHLGLYDDVIVFDHVDKVCSFSHELLILFTLIITHAKL